MHEKQSLGGKIFDISNYTLLILLVLVTLYPVLHVTLASISKPTEVMRHTGLILAPLGLTLDSYKAVFDNPMILIGYKNTIVYVLLGTLINLFLTCIGAYVLSRRDFYWKNPLMIMIVVTMFFSGGMIPFYLTVMKLNMIDTIWVMLLPNAINTMNLIIMRTSFLSIPQSLEESAFIDGANDLVILFRVIVPLSLPIISVMILFYGVAHWNSWFNAMIFLRSRTKYPLQLILREILITNSMDSMTTAISGVDKEPVSATIKYATIMVATLPVLFIYPFLQKYFVKGVMIGALKE